MNISILQQRKKELNISYDEIALRSGVPRATVTNVMCGYTKRPRIDTVQAIARVLGIESIWITEDYASDVQGTKKVSITTDEEDILIIFREIGNKLGLEGQNTFKTLGKALLDMNKG